MPEPLTQKEVLAKLARGGSFYGKEVGDVSFREYCFKKEVNFSNAVFIGRADFFDAQFLNGARFDNTEFSGTEGANFNGARFSGKKGANFDMAQFTGEGKADFMLAEFSGEEGADFMNSKFTCKGGADFNESQFSGKGPVDFQCTEFSSRVTFEAAQFLNEKGVYFFEAKFSGKGRVDFSWTRFSTKEGVDFTRAEFSSDLGVDFRSAKFLGPGKFNFEATKFKENQPIFFDKIETDFPENLQFIDVSNLGSALFLYVELEKVSFKNVRFRLTKNKLSNREYLADEKRNEIVIEEVYSDYEIIANNLDYFNQVEILYRKLKLNFETQLDFHRAGDFHYGEMEMRRKAKMLEWEDKPVSKYLPFLKYLNLTQCYKIVSGYGEKWVQALASFVAVWLVFTGLNLFWVEPKAAMPQEQPSRIEQWEKDSIHRLGGSALFSFKVLTLQRWGDEFQLTGTSYFPRFFVTLQHLIGPTIIALMLLAIRRQFRR
jgi:uncharacterized protein YjbI with pentapeptide repeats